jgi:carnitine-CoA ligase
MIINGHKVIGGTVKDVVALRRALGAKSFAIVDGVTLTYEQVDDVSNRIANSLTSRGVGKGDVVATYMHNSVDHICIWLACTKIGAIWAPVNTALVNLDLAYTLRDAAPKALFLDGGLLENYAKIRDAAGIADENVVIRGAAEADGQFGSEYREMLVGSAAEPIVEVSPTDPAAILYTGGSTGLPKGVVVSNLSFIAAAARYQEMFDPTDTDVHFGVGQMCHAIGSAVDVFCPLYWGLTTVIPQWFSASMFWEQVRRHDATILGCIIGPLISALLKQPPRADDKDHRLRTGAAGSGQIPAERVTEFTERFGLDLLEIYGQSETGALGVVGQRPHDRPYRSQGRPNGWCDVMIGGDDDQPCAPGVEGQILLRPTVPHTFMLGYHNKADKFVEACRNLWFHTGDLGHLDEQGYLHFSGRMAHYIRRRGENIAAVEVEHMMLMHSAVSECAVVGVPSELGEEDVKAYVQLADGAEGDPAELVTFCAERLAYFKVPRYVEFVSALPRSITKNEIERHTLKAQGIGAAWDREAAGIRVGRQRA